MLHLGDVFPKFTADTTQGEINFYEWLDESWGILFSHPSDFTPVCTTELARVLTLVPEFKKRNVKVIGLSCDTVESHNDWCKDIQCYAGCNENEPFPYPIIEDKARNLAVKLGMVDKDELDSSGIPLTARAVYIIDPKKKFRLSILYPATTGRNFESNPIIATDQAKVRPSWAPLNWNAKRVMSDSPSRGPLSGALETSHSMERPPKRSKSLVTYQSDNNNKVTARVEAPEDALESCYS
ncbi:Peroxiredoxin-6 [Papilio xuthus]|uniref:Peroxiredoxin-6 n=1 Tax=Papilio xuthus TaxID=66420 RepID=A0A194PL75_PAPXU|nr:Peroxiredoxin-6 [Papilio xuthus]